jgi:hypothetical protein
MRIYRSDQPHSVGFPARLENPGISLPLCQIGPRSAFGFGLSTSAPCKDRVTTAVGASSVFTWTGTRRRTPSSTLRCSANEISTRLDRIYTAHASILPPGAPMISGRAAIKEFWSNLIQSANVKSAVLASVETMPAGDGVVEIGRATLTVEPEGGPRPR